MEKTREERIADYAARAERGEDLFGENSGEQKHFPQLVQTVKSVLRRKNDDGGNVRLKGFRQRTATIY